MRVVRQSWTLISVRELEVQLGSLELIRIELFEARSGGRARYRCRFLLLSEFALDVANADGVVDGVSLWGDFHAMLAATPDLTKPYAATSRADAMRRAQSSLSQRISTLRGDPPRRAPRRA